MCGWMGGDDAVLQEEERRLACFRSLQKLLSSSLQLKIKIKSQPPFPADLPTLRG